MSVFIKYIGLFWITVLFPIFTLHAQVDSSILAMADWVKAYNHFGKYNPQEKVYLHFDNTGYYLGETMWFAAYVVTAPQLRPTEMSKVLYVELLTPEGRIVETKKLKIKEGRCHGEFVLTPTQLASGFYEVRAYTRVMLNWEDTYYSRVFPVLDKPEIRGEYTYGLADYPEFQRYIQARPRMEKLKSLNLSFYPEGGELVEGLPGRVAFKAVDDEGRSVAVSGTVYDSDERPVATLETRHQGMGSFTLTPGDEPCRAEITYDGKTYRYTLPEAKAAGYTLGIDNSSGDSLHIKIRRSREIQGGWVGLTVSCRGIAHSFEVADLRGQEEADLHLSKADFPAGVQQITLFTPEGEVLGERLAYHQRDDQQLHITVDGQKSSYRPYEKITLPLHVTDAAGSPVATTLSVSVRDAGTEIPTHYASTLSANLLLESDVKGYIEDIGYYFESDDAEHWAALDLLLLVQGWRRYEWRQQAGVEPFEPVHRVEEGIMVQGRVLSNTVRRNEPVENVDISVWIYSERTNCRGEARSDSLGRFSFLSHEDIWGKNEMVLQTQKEDRRGKKKNRYYLIELDRVFSPPVRPYTRYEVSKNIMSEEDSEKSETETPDSVSYDTAINIDTMNVHNLPEVDVKSRRKLGSSLRIEYDAGEIDDQMFDAGDFRHFTGSVWELLEYTNPDFSGKYKRRGVQIIANGLYFGETDEIDRIVIVENITVDDIKYYTEECGFRGGDFVYGSAIPPVFVLLFLKPYEELRRTPKGYRRTTLQGYSIPAEFYHTDYSQGVLPDEQDYRRTLYWNPALATDSLGRAYIDFYNNSNVTRPRINAETLTIDGKTAEITP